MYKRSAIKKRDIGIENEYEEYIDEVVWTHTDKSGNQLPPWERGDARFWISKLDYAYDEAYCGDWCGCGGPHSNLELWMDFLRSQEVYPPPALSRPIFYQLQNSN